ncbi:MAG: glycosyltransferase family A protein [Anaerolineales bacterium]
MRVGQNPAKFIDHVAQPQKITVAVVSYIPFLGGFYTESLDVLKACLDSLAQNSDLPFDLLVFANASCPPVRAFLNEMAQAGQIQYLLLSDKNLGKGGAWNFIFAAAPGEFIAYADSDIYFRPGWLSATMQIMEAFPQAGMVTARPMRTPEKFYTRTLEWARQQPDLALENGQYVLWQVYWEHVASLGISEEQARQWFESRSDWRVTRDGVSALISAAHFQFTARKSILQQFLPLQMDRPMGQVRSLDEMINEHGYLRLTTCEPLVKHMGNRLDPALEAKASASPAPARRGLWQIPWVRQSLLKLYDRIFKLYYG